jgi:hypothetical protein
VLCSTLEARGRLKSDTAALALVVALGVLLAPGAATAHEIPASVTVQVFVKPEGAGLRVLVRAPLEAMRDIDFPLRDGTFLDLERAAPHLDDAARLWIADALTLVEDGARLGAPRRVLTRAALPSDRSFLDYDTALGHITEPALPPDTRVPWNQAMLDVLLEYDIASDESRFSIRPAFDRLGLRVNTVLRFLPPGGTVRAFQLSGDPGLVRLDPRWHQAAFHFTRLGFLHILDGTDHLLFVLCLVIPFRRFRPLVLIVTSFTVAHSITLMASALDVAPGVLWFPPLVETLIALSIVYMALENVVFALREGEPVDVRRRLAIAFGFGLVHGFGFSFALRETLQFAGAHLVTSLLAFNVGVELGQVLALAVFVPALYLLFRYVVVERTGAIILSALVAHTAWHWMTERGSELGEFGWPAPDAVFLLWTLRLLLAVMIVGGVAWLVGSMPSVASASRRKTSTAETRPSEAGSHEVE